MSKKQTISKKEDWKIEGMMRAISKMATLGPTVRAGISNNLFDRYLLWFLTSLEKNGGKTPSYRLSGEKA
tara:strand:- start:6489 stop:6698 length:210 start_codon:yes stop_codon:yes gene_type:complete